MSRSVEIRFCIESEAVSLRICKHGAREEEVEGVLINPEEDRLGKE